VDNDNIPDGESEGRIDVAYDLVKLANVVQDLTKVVRSVMNYEQGGAFLHNSRPLKNVEDQIGKLTRNLNAWEIEHKKMMKQQCVIMDKIIVLDDDGNIKNG